MTEQANGSGPPENQPDPLDALLHQAAAQFANALVKAHMVGTQLQFNPAQVLVDTQILSLRLSALEEEAVSAGVLMEKVKQRLIYQLTARADELSRPQIARVAPAVRQ